MYAWLVGLVLRAAYRGVAEGRLRLVEALTADDVDFEFPGSSSFAGRYHGKAELLAWLRRFGALQPQFMVHEVTVAGPPWNVRASMRFSDAIGDDYRNSGMEHLRIRWGRVRSVQVFLDTEAIAAWESRHPEVRQTRALPVTG